MMLTVLSRHVTRSCAELRLGEPFLARNGSISQQTQQSSPSCQTAKMTFAWKAAGLT
jgi:hypothetical protein